MKVSPCVTNIRNCKTIILLLILHYVDYTTLLVLKTGTRIHAPLNKISFSHENNVRLKVLRCIPNLGIEGLSSCVY